MDLGDAAVFSGMLVVANFLDDVYEAEAGAAVDEAASFAVNTFFTAIFTVELLVNMYAHWFRAFFFNGWNLFDMFSVSVSLLALLSPIDISTVRCDSRGTRNLMPAPAFKFIPSLCTRS